MAQRQVIIRALKHQLKAQGKSYADLACALGLSEASIKRMFSRQTLSLERLDRICDFLETSISDLIESLDAEKQSLKQLTYQQEEELLKSPKLLLVAICALNHWEFKDILDHYTIAPAECTQLLIVLDRLKLLELLPENRIKLLVAPNFSWISRGPIQHYFKKHLQQDFFNTDFSQPGELLLVKNGMLSRESNQIFQRALRKLSEEFERLNKEDATLALEQKFGTSALLAIRPWELAIFQHLRRPETKQQY